jgi:hypothetical protein
MLEVCFFLFLILLFYGAGRLFLDLIRFQENDLPFTLPSAIGLVVVTVTVTWYYKLGGNLNRFFWIISTVVAGFLLWRLITRRSNLFQSLSGFPIEFLTIAIFAAAIFLPTMLGGEQFTIFRGNHHDSFNYLESAITYRKMSFPQISGLDPVELVRRGLFKFGQENLLYRPEITFLYAMLSSFYPGAFIRLDYVLLVYFQFLSFTAVRAVAAKLLPARRIIPVLLAAALVGGFWGQYILDIDSWSQSACTPLAVFSLLLLIKLTETASNSGTLHFAPKLLALYAIAWIGMFYLYPEAAGFLLPAHIVCWVVAAWFFGLRVSWFASGMTGLSVFGLLLPVFNSNVMFLIQQGGLSLSGLNWWMYFQAFFFGRDGVNHDLFSNAADLTAGALGIYFITPDSAMNLAVAGTERTLILLCAVVLIVRMARGLRSLRSPAWWLLGSYVGASLLCILGLFALRQYWTAGKAFSFVAYLVLLLLVAPAFRTPSFDSKWLSRLAKVTAGAFLLLQLGFLFYRPVASCKPFAIHYPPPYPSVPDPMLKEIINFADWSILRHLRSGDHVTVHIEDPFIQSFVRILLLSHHVKFCLEPPAFAGSSRLSIIPTGNCPNPTVRLVAEKSTQGPFAFQLSLIAPEGARQPESLTNP